MRNNALPIGHIDYRTANAKKSHRIVGENCVEDDSTLNYQREKNSASYISYDNTAYPINTNQSFPGLLNDIQQRHRPP